ncbi:MAG: sensor histidine kinase, partial [Pseudomonadota bacterium]
TGQTVDRILCISRPLPQRDVADPFIHGSLAAIANLLRLQARETADMELRAALDSAATRVHAVGALHTHLYHVSAGQGDAVPLRSYLDPLVTGVVHSLGDGRVTLLREIDDIALPYADARGLALILTEAVVNAIRHGFSDRAEGGLIHVSLQAREGGTARMVVSDCGVGFPPAFDWRDARRIGGRIMELYANRIGGTLSLSDAPMGGVRVEVVC